MLRLFLAVALAGSLLAGLATQAQAAKPRLHACMGTTLQLQLSEFGGRGLGQDTSGAARELRGLGEVIQAFQAGDVPDELEPNTCND